MHARVRGMQIARGRVKIRQSRKAMRIVRALSAYVCGVGACDLRTTYTLGLRADENGRQSPAITRMFG